MRPVTLITGASAGIGTALAHEFARHGHELLLIARREPRLVSFVRLVRPYQSAPTLNGRVTPMNRELAMTETFGRRRTP